MQISSLVGKPVLTRSGEWLGYVIALRLSRDFKKLSCLICADGDEEEFFLPMRAVFSAEDAVIAGGKRADAPTGIPCPVGRPAYTHTGEFCGAVADVDLGDAPALMIADGSGERRVPVSCTVPGETVIVYPSEEERRRAGSGRRKTAGMHRTAVPHSAPARRESVVPVPSEEQDKAAKAGPALSSDEPPARTSGEVPAAEEEHTATKEPATAGHVAYRLDRTNLLGRRVKRSVYNARGVAIATAGERITAEIIARARRENRLLALTVNTLTNFY